MLFSGSQEEGGNVNFYKIDNRWTQSDGNSSHDPLDEMSLKRSTRVFFIKI
jgi:hypothetical protein